MSYCTQSDIENLFGTTNVKVWSNLENDADEADTARITAAIAYAAEQVNKRFRRSKYAVPLTALPGESLVDITDIAARFAGVWLYESRGIDVPIVADETAIVQSVSRHRGMAERAIRRYLSGQDTLPAVLASRGVSAPFVP